MIQDIEATTVKDREAALRDLFQTIATQNAERREAVTLALPALQRLCEAMGQRTGQSYYVRALLYSLWNGKPTDLSDVLNLDWPIRKDLCAVILAFGFEDSARKVAPFFYDAVKAAIEQAGLWGWFIDAEMGAQS